MKPGGRPRRLVALGASLLAHLVLLLLLPSRGGPGEVREKPPALLELAWGEVPPPPVAKPTLPPRAERRRPVPPPALPPPSTPVPAPVATDIPRRVQLEPVVDRPPT